MTRQFYNERIRRTQNHGKPVHKDPCEAYNAGVDLKASTDATWARKSEPKINGNNAAAGAEACEVLEDVADKPKEERARERGRTSRPNGRPNKKPKAASWQSHVFTAAALRTMTFPPVSYIIPGIIPEGLTILAGRPKIGKSWMALDLAIGISTGQPVLGGIHVEQGDVLYCCLEDNPRRLQRRVTKLLSPFGVEWPERLTLATRWQKLDEGGVEDIEAWCNSVSKPRLVLLDTLAGVRQKRASSDTPYEGDYEAMQEIHRIANERGGLGVMPLHHTRKMDADDPLDTISGTLGLTGAVDTALVLSRSSKGTTLYARGRDIEEGERAIIFGTESCKWTLLGDAAEVHRSDTRKKVLEVLNRATDLMPPAEVAHLTGIERNNADQQLTQTVSAGEVIRVTRGRYALPNKRFAIPSGMPKKPKT